MANEVVQPEKYQQLLEQAATLLLQRGNDLFTCLDVTTKHPLTQPVPQTPVSSPSAVLSTAGAEEKTENQHEDLADDFFELV